MWFACGLPLSFVYMYPTHALSVLSTPRCRATIPPHRVSADGTAAPAHGVRMGPGPSPAHAKKGSIARAQEGINSKCNIICI